MTLTLKLFGAPVLQLNGSPVPLSRRKAMALLSFLAVTRNRHHRETLAALLWPESDAAAAYSALRNVLWILRQSPLAEAIRGDRSTVELAETESLAIDVNRFRDLSIECPARAHGLTEVCARCEPLLKEAVDLWQGSFMSGFAVANSVRFDDWQFAEGQALRRELTEILDRLIEYYASIEDWMAGARYARSWLQVDALSEMACRRLMYALAAQGRRSDALETYGECVDILSAELGLAPEEATRELAERIRSSKSEAPARRKTRLHRLPPILAPMIGRREVANRIERMFLEDGCRLVSVVGLGGSGKTSLALHVAHQMENQFEHGVFFIPLDSLAGGSVVASTVIQVLGISPSREQGSELGQRLLDHLEDRNALLILDGAERVLPQVSVLTQTLADAPQVQILLTSRIALEAEGEVAVVLRGLECPEVSVPAERLAEYAAVRLLRIAVQRQGQVHEHNADEFSGMARVARLLEGSPLGLEMAAGWRSVLTWDEIADRVSGNLEFLVHMREDVAPKHRTFAAVFEQAWEMLPEEAQTALGRLSVFRGAFTIEAAEYVTESLAGSLALLVNRCMIKRIGPDRYEIHALLRQFAAGKLSDDGHEIDRIENRHAEFYMNSVATWFEKLTGSEQYPMLERMGQEIANVRSALQHAAEIGATEMLCEACEGLFFYYDMRTQFEEAKKVFQNATDAYVGHPNRDGNVEAFLRVASGWFAAHAQPDVTMERIAGGLRLLEDGSPTNRLHAMANVIGAYASGGEDVESHIQRAKASTEFYTKCGDVWGEGLATAAWASLEAARDTGKAEALAFRSLRLHREAGDAWGEGLVLLFLARMAEREENYVLALARYEESQRLSEPIAEDITGVIDAIASQARITGRLGELERSERLAERALGLSRGIGSRLQIGRSLIELARARRMLGDPASARSLLEESFSLLSHRQWDYMQERCALLLFDLALDERDIGAAERWFQETAVLDSGGDHLPELSKKLTELRNGCKE